MNGRRLFNILFWSGIGLLSFAATDGVEDPNAPSRTSVLRRQLQEEQIQPVYLSMTSVSTVDLESLIAGLEQLKVPVQNEKKQFRKRVLRLRMHLPRPRRKRL